MLTDGKEEIFLHKKEALDAYRVGEKITVFVYVDNNGRKTASTRMPKIVLGEAAFLDVVGSNYEYGVFLDNNLVKDLLLSKDDLPFNLDLWPVPNDKLFVELKEKKNTLFAKFVGRKQVTSFFPPSEPLTEDTKYQAYVSYLLEEGLVCFTEKGDEIFVHHNNTRRSYRLGELVWPRILKVNPEAEYVGTLIEQKESMIDTDAKTILDYLDGHKGTMRFTDKSTPEEIQAAFKMSKSAFKRALGSLYKQGLVVLESDKTTRKQS